MSRQNLYKILEEHDAVAKLYIAAINHKPSVDQGNAEDTIDLLFRNHGRRMIDRSCSWSDTAQGHSFWRNINDEVKNMPVDYIVRMEF